MGEPGFLLSRSTPRFSFIAEAEVTSQSDGTRLVARVAELSSRGCYIDTINPFPIGTQLRFRIRYACSVCELPGKIIYNHSGFGMGVLFGDVPGPQRAVLDAWLGELAGKSC